MWSTIRHRPDKCGPLNASTKQSERTRFAPFDVLRGLVIVLMALDHVRGFVAPSGANPTDWESTTFAFFLVRWVTHLCAPMFVFLMGVGASLRAQSKPDESRSFLIKRGLWLIALEVTWVSFCWSWDVTQTNLGVLWSLGGSMVLLAPLVRLRSSHMVAAGVLLIVGLEMANVQPSPGPLRVLFQPTSMTVFGHHIGAAYVLLPWFGVAMLGWGVGPWLMQLSPRRMCLVGVGLLTLFVTYRWGAETDPNPWVSQSAWDMTLADFLSPSKYPPSLCFVLMTLGVGGLILAGPARGQGRISSVLQTFGRVPMFFYLLHLPLAHLLGNGYAWIRYGAPRVPGTESLSILTILVAWCVVLIVLWPVCVRWDALKRKRRDLRWLQYL